MKRWTKKQLETGARRKDPAAGKTGAKQAATQRLLTGKQLRTGAALFFFAAAVLCYAVGTPSRAAGFTEEGNEALLVQDAVLEKEKQEEAKQIPDGQMDSGEAAAPDFSAGNPAEAGGQPETVERVPIYVHVCGAVEHPDVYALAEGSRIWEAVEAAGGFTAEAADRTVNLAGFLTDGEQIWIPTEEEAETLPLEMGAGSGVGVSAQGGKVNLNTASKETLMTLTGIGEARADAILAYRQTAGGFQTIEDIMKVSGIKESAFQKIKDDITV